MQHQQTPFISLQARVSIATHELRLRLQEKTGLSIPKLLDLAFREYEKQLNAQPPRQDIMS